MSRIVFAVCTFAMLLSVTLTIASAGDLKQIQAAQKVAAQKLAHDVDDAIDRSRKQDPTDAKFTLRAMLTRVKDSPDLLEKERQPLVTRLQTRINVVEEAIRAKRVNQDTAPLPRDTTKYRPPVSEPGKGVTGAAKSFIDSAKGAAQTNADLIRDREKGRLGVDAGLEKAGVLTDKDITLPKDWKERQAARVSQKLTPKEAAVLKSLNSTLSVDYNNDKLKSVLNHLMEKTGLTIIVDEGSLKDADIDYEAEVTLKFPKMAVRTALKKILGDKGLTYVIKDGNILVMTPKKASEYTVIRTYQLDDLVTPDPRIQMMFGPFVAQAQKIQNGNIIVNLIQSTIEPTYWQPNGPGTIVFEPLTGTLIVRASAEMHYQLGSPGLFGGR